jgi:hypothetical protein
MGRRASLHQGLSISRMITEHLLTTDLAHGRAIVSLRDARSAVLYAVRRPGRLDIQCTTGAAWLSSRFTVPLLDGGIAQ